MKNRVDQKNCQAQWVESYQEYKVFDTKASNQKLFVIPCSLWAYNLNYNLFMAITNEKTGKATYIKPIYFIRHSSYKGLYADVDISNINWDQENYQLTSLRTLDGSQICGEIAGYDWDHLAQDFKLRGIVKNDDCRNPEGWEELQQSWKSLKETN